MQVLIHKKQTTKHKLLEIGMNKYKPLMTINRLIRVPAINRLSLIALLVIFLSGCTGDHSTSTITELNTDSEVRSMETFGDMKHEGVDSDLIKLVRRATARYHSTNQALRAGYVPGEDCVDHPDLGGMGYHWVNFELIDPYFDPANPEALLYEPDKNGNQKLVGVEYIVIDLAEEEYVGQNPPYFGDHPFDVGGTPMPDPHYSLHVWLYKDNPNGFFTPFNPNVTCN